MQNHGRLVSLVVLLLTVIIAFAAYLHIRTIRPLAQVPDSASAPPSGEESSFLVQTQSPLDMLKRRLSGSPDFVSLAAKVEPAVVYIEVLDRNRCVIGQGSGFFVGPNLVITNWHVVDGGPYLRITTAEGKTCLAAGVIKKDIAADIALVSVPSNGHNAYLSLSTSLPPVGENVMVVGHPKGFAFTVSTGIVSALRAMSPHGLVIQTTAPISPGSSGGPMLSPAGEVLGVVTFQHIEGQNLNFAVSARAVAPLLDGLDPQTGKPEVTLGLVTGIMWSHEKPSAIIDCDIVKQGDVVHGATVSRIGENAVEFEKNGKKWTQAAGEKPDPARWK